MVGLPSAGKTSRARELASTWNALRLTPDEWMIPLFGHELPEGKRNVLEGRLIWLALSALRIGVNVDFGVWAMSSVRRCERWQPPVGANWFTCRWTRRSSGAESRLAP
jgi:hypothetical protein